MQNWLKKIGAEKLGTFVEFFPQEAIETISWLEFVKQAGSIVKTSTHFTGQKNWRRSLRSDLPQIWLSKPRVDLLASKQWEQLTPEVRDFWGEQILELHFRSVISWEKTNLDFRPFRFFLSPDTAVPASYWEFSRFFTNFESDFCSQLRLLYKGYYDNRPKDLRMALVQLGFLGTEQDYAEIEKILFGNLGEASDKPIPFSSKMFQTMKSELFRYLKRHNKKIPANFIWFGLSMAGMYETLELLGGKYNVRKAYRRVVPMEEGELH